MPNLLITGANRGIGLEFVRGYAADGWHVHACCRQPDRARALKAVEGDVVLHRVDVTDGLRVASLARELAGEPIDILINNAGIYGPRDSFGNVQFGEWSEVFEVNAIAPIRVVQRFVDLVAASDRKLIVNISSRMGSISQTSGGGSYFYRASKAALNMVVKALSADLADRGITLVAFHPGWVQTDMGGPNAAVGPVESVAGMRAVIEGLGAADTGKFFDYQGEEIPW